MTDVTLDKEKFVENLVKRIKDNFQTYPDDELRRDIESAFTDTNPPAPAVAEEVVASDSPWRTDTT